MFVLRNRKFCAHRPVRQTILRKATGNEGGFALRKSLIAQIPNLITLSVISCPLCCGTWQLLQTTMSKSPMMMKTVMALRIYKLTQQERFDAFVFPAKAYEQRQNEEIRCLSSKTLSLVLGCGTCDRLKLETPQWRSSQSCDKGAVGWSTKSLFFSSLSRIGYRSPFPCQ